MTEMSIKTPVILGSYVNAYGLVRSFAEAGLHSIVVAWKDDITCHSRLAEIHSAPDPVGNEVAFIDSLMNLGRSLPDGGFLLCTDDATVSLTARHRRLLEEHYCIPGVDWEVLGRCVDKRPMYDAALRANILIPFTRFCDNSDSICLIADDLPYPCMIKPAVTVGFMELLGLPGRTITVQNKDELMKLAAHLKNVELNNREYVIQEIIPGGAECLYTITAYCNKSTEIIAYSTGHKIRQHPPDAGTIISGRVVATAELLEPAQRLVSELGFQGICNIEFKKDAQTGEFKLIEINARPGMWNYSATASGINLAYIAYTDLVLNKVQPFDPSKEELVWIMTLDDLWHSVRAWRHNGYANYSIGLIQWCKTLHGRKVDPVFNLRDIGPWLFLFRHKVIFPLANKLKRYKCRLSEITHGGKI